MVDSKFSRRAVDSTHPFVTTRKGKGDIVLIRKSRMSPFVILLTGDSNKRGEQRDRQSLCRISRVRWGERRHWHSTARGDVVAAARMNTRPKVPPNRRINPPTFKDRLQMSWDAAAFSSPKSSARPVSRYRGNGNGRNPLSLALRPEEFLSAPIGSRASWAQQRDRLARPSFCPISVVARSGVVGGERGL
jgi:hypothetical protein